MDVINDGFFDDIPQNDAPMFETTAIKLPLPQEDFDETGRVKRVRKRMLKKLLKCEYRYLFPVLFGFIGLMLLLGLALSIQIRLFPGGEASSADTWLMISTMLFIYSIGAVAIFAVSYPTHRYNQNFFKNEGYLTFSIPASAEEHVLAKRISAVVCLTIALFSIVLCLILVALISGGGEILGTVFSAIGDLYSLEPVHAIFFTLELLVSIAVGFVAIPSALGAGACLTSKYTGRKRIGRTAGIVFALIFAFEAFMMSLLTSDALTVFNSPVGIHLLAWLKILVEAGLGVGCFFYEVHFLKHKLNLK